MDTHNCASVGDHNTTPSLNTRTSATSPIPTLIPTPTLSPTPILTLTLTPTAMDPLKKKLIANVCEHFIKFRGW